VIHASCSWTVKRPGFDACLSLCEWPGWLCRPQQQASDAGRLSTSGPQAAGSVSSRPGCRERLMSSVAGTGWVHWASSGSVAGWWRRPTGWCTCFRFRSDEWSLSSCERSVVWRSSPGRRIWSLSVRNALREVQCDAGGRELRRLTGVRVGELRLMCTARARHAHRRSRQPRRGGHGLRSLRGLSISLASASRPTKVRNQSGTVSP
jgi:hypothetical protein